jgi:uncharacterized protein (TIGR02996 family)
MTREAFLEAIRDDPDDDAPRLIYADWLEDHAGPAGRARAAFIRAQVRLAALPPDHPARPGLEDEAGDLLAGHEEEWVAPFRRRVFAWEFRRGFVERVTLPAESFLEHAAALLAAGPVREVHLLLSEDQVETLADCPHLARVEALDFGPPTPEHPANHLRDRSLIALLASPHLGRLRALGWASNGVEGPGVQALAESPRLSQLRRLDFRWNWTFGDRAVRILAGATRAANLEVLLLGGTNLTAAGVQALFASRCLPRLGTLEVNAGALFRPPRGVDNPADGLRALLALPLASQVSGLDFSEAPQMRTALAVLAGGPALPRLQSLNLSGCRVGNAGARALAESPQLAALTSLNLGACNLGHAALQALATSPHLAGLTDLSLAANDVRDTGVKALAGSPHLTRLGRLNLIKIGVGGPGIRALAAWPGLAGLRELHLSDNYVNPQSVQALADSPHLGNLESLSLANTHVEAAGARALAASANFGRLRHLDLGHTALGDEGVRALAAATWPRLVELNLGVNQLGRDGARALAAAPGLRRLRRLDLRHNNLTDAEWELLHARFGRAVLR